MSWPMAMRMASRPWPRSEHCPSLVDEIAEDPPALTRRDDLQPADVVSEGAEVGPSTSSCSGAQLRTLTRRPYEERLRSTILDRGRSRARRRTRPRLPRRRTGARYGRPRRDSGARGLRPSCALRDSLGRSSPCATIMCSPSRSSNGCLRASGSGVERIQKPQPVGRPSCGWSGACARAGIRLSPISCGTASRIASFEVELEDLADALDRAASTRDAQASSDLTTLKTEFATAVGDVSGGGGNRTRARGHPRTGRPRRTRRR